VIDNEYGVERKPKLTIEDGFTLYDMDHTPMGDGDDHFLDVRGTIEHTVKFSGWTEVCITIPTATRETPVLIHLGVHDTEPPTTHQDEEQDVVKKSVNGMEYEMKYLQQRVDAIIRQADFAKTQDHDMHEHSRKMSSAAMIWPVIQIVALIVTGVVQATSLVGYLKSRHVF